jgi:hypothetical protein
MAITTTPAALVQTNERRSFWLEYVRDSGFKPYMGAGGEATQKPISVAIETKKGGETIKIPILMRLKGRGTSGNATLTGNEEALGKYVFTSRVDMRRHAIIHSEWDEHKAFAKSYEESKPRLKLWCEEQVRDQIIDAFAMAAQTGSAFKTYVAPISNPTVADPSSIICSASTTGENNTWLTNNTDRILFGADGQPGAAVNLVGGNFAGSLANLDATADKPSAAFLSRLKMKARSVADPHIRPIRVNNGSGREYFVVFCDSRSFAVLKTDSTILTSNQNARPRDVEQNPIFQDGDLLWDGLVIREIPEMAPIPKALYSTTFDVGRFYLCGAQALCFSWGAEPDFREADVTDYGIKKGIGVQEIRGCQKIQVNITPGAGDRTVDIGLASGFVGLND